MPNNKQLYLEALSICQKWPAGYQSSIVERISLLVMAIQPERSFFPFLFLFLISISSGEASLFIYLF